MRGSALWPLAAALVAGGAWLAPWRPHPAAVWSHVPAEWLQGLAALEAGAPGEAAAALARAEEAAGDAPPELLRARLCASLRADLLRDAEIAAEKLATASAEDADADALCDFVHALADYARCRRAQAEAAQPDLDPTAFDRGIRLAHRAAAGFQRAAMARGDWPAARRNAERALAALAELERGKEQRAQQQRQAQNQPEPPPAPPEQIEREVGLDEEQRLLTADELQALLDRLAAAEKEKRALRSAAQRARGSAVERDW